MPPKSKPAQPATTAPDHATLLRTLEARFTANPNRHPGIKWADVATRLQANPAALASLHQMEATGGEPDLVQLTKSAPPYTFIDCAPETPAGRRSLCYDAEALAARKENRPAGSAVDAAAAIGVQLLTEDQYRQLQQHGEFDLKTSSWILTPSPIRKLGGALFCDRRYGQVFTYHNGAQSYYASRGFRAILTL